MYDEIEDNEYNGNSWDYDDLDNWASKSHSKTRTTGSSPTSLQN